jgi:hypothetical protein
MSVDGNWNVTMNTPMGAQKATLSLATSGGTLTGQMKGAQGAMDLNDGKVDGDNVSWTANLTQPMPIKLEFTGKVDGDKIGGSVKLGAFGNATWEGTRA